ncbi:MAG TPA: hypothetical protein VGO47_07030 [Chlamydiales bacterium]|jgi:hypothetical protein|nr:hypothetical protein [Chlamydiales bacterium]
MSTAASRFATGNVGNSGTGELVVFDWVKNLKAKRTNNRQLIFLYGI